MTIYHVRAMDLHAPGEHCNSYDCSAVVMRHEYDAAVRERDEARAIVQRFMRVALDAPVTTFGDMPADSAPLFTEESALAGQPVTPARSCALGHHVVRGNERTCVYCGADTDGPGTLTTTTVSGVRPTE